MDFHQKKKNQYKVNQKSIHGHVVGRENQIQSIQSKSNPNPITQYCNTDFLIIIKKKKTPIQRKPNPKPRANQTHSETVSSLRRSSSSSSCSSTPRRRLLRGPHRRSQIVDGLAVSATSVLGLGLKVFLSQSLTLSLSLSLSLSH